LVIRNATLHDEGTYRAVATNDSGSATSRAFVKFDGMLILKMRNRADGGVGAVSAPSGAAPPKFTIALGDVRATEGQPLKLECKVEASPLPEFVWYKDGERIKPSDRLRLEVDPDGMARLVIPKCTMDDDGIYRVIATNPVGSAHDKANATVKRAPGAVMAALTPERDLFDSNRAPRLIIPLETCRVSEGSRIAMRCKFSGDPKPTLKWFKDGERIYPFGRCEIVSILGTIHLRCRLKTTMVR
jgi:hypothetical protein